MNAEESIILPAAPTCTWEQAVEWLREQTDQQEFVRQCYYDDPVLAAAARFCASEEWSAIRDLLRGHLPGRVLELGAGRGIVSFAFSCIGCEVTALEPDPSPLVGRGAIEELSRFSPQPIRILSEWGERILAEDATFDVVFCRCVLHHAQDLRQLCREVFRVLKPGGIFLAEREHVIERREDLEAFLKSHPLHHLYGGENAYLLDEYKSAIRSAGLRLRRSIPPYHHVINFVPPMSTEYLGTMTRQALAKIFPSAVANVMAKNQGVRALYARSLSWRYHVPGKFYSFLAERPA
jgi:ubiquinone/menaquinone biosynthesis C-methylase UbiE